MKHTKRRGLVVAGFATLLGAASVAAAGPASAASGARAHTIDITAIDDAYKIDTHGTVPAGLVQIRFADHGKESHQAQLFRLNDGVSYQQFVADLHSPSPEAFLGDALPAGGASDIAPHEDQTVWDALQGGTYVVVCFDQSPDGVPHFVKGMYAPFTVSGHVSDAKLAAAHPAEDVDGVIAAHDMTYTMPSVIHDGGLYRYQDTDAHDAHELDFARLLPGKTIDDAKAWFAGMAAPTGPMGPPPFVASGGFGGVLPGGGGWFRADAEPGDYIAFCLIPDDQTHMPHAAMGMVVGFTVK